eukprot:GHVS01070318.1.p1 GENE.GHVS01070318.1~~GHVS01070318.1.p1  ORF type:complete len:528 (+),score=76.71 GHVS01070318.1:289-1872(+)
MESWLRSCWLLAAAILCVLVLSISIYSHFISTSSWFSAVVIVATLGASFLSVIIIPLDIFIITQPDISSLSLHLTQPSLQKAYFGLLAFLLFSCFLAIPFAHFYGQTDPFEDEPCERCFAALRQTVVFVAVVVVLLLCGLFFKLDSNINPNLKELSWVKQLLDVDHSGYGAITFTVACLTGLGCYAWTTYTAYGLASLPLLWLRSPASTLQLRKEVETDIAELRYQQRALQAKNAGSFSAMNVDDKNELTRLERQQIALGHRNYKLQEQASASFVGTLIHLLVPFKMAAGCAMLVLSLLVFVSLLFSIVDRWLHSRCGWRCGFVLTEPSGGDRFWTPLDAVLLNLSEYFPVDFAFFCVVVVYVFAASLYAVLRLGIRWLCVAPNNYAIRPHKTKPQALLFLCFLMAHILLAFTMTLTTLAPHYVSYGTQTYTPPNGSAAISCYPLAPADSTCRLSVTSLFFSRIDIGIPFASLFYFVSNLIFLMVFAVTAIRHAICLDKPKSILQQLEEDDCVDEESTGLLQMGKTV